MNCTFQIITLQQMHVEFRLSAEVHLLQKGHLGIHVEHNGGFNPYVTSVFNGWIRRNWIENSNGCWHHVEENLADEDSLRGEKEPLCTREARGHVNLHWNSNFERIGHTLTVIKISIETLTSPWYMIWLLNSRKLFPAINSSKFSTMSCTWRPCHILSIQLWKSCELKICRSLFWWHKKILNQKPIEKG